MDDSISVSQALRRCLILGGHAHHQELRQWALRELTGYGPDDRLPPYRMVPAVITVDLRRTSSRRLVQQISGERISHHALPAAAREAGIGECVPLREGVKALETLVAGSKKEIYISPPGAAEYALLMTQENESFGYDAEFTSLGWEVATPIVEDVLDQIRTRLAVFVAEMRAQMPAGQQNPNPRAVENAARQAFEIKTGSNSPVNINAPSVSADRGSTASANTNEPSLAAPQPWFQRSSVLVAAAGVLVAGIGVFVTWLVAK